MNHTMNSKKNAVRIERIQHKRDAGIVSTHFPEVAGIVINMTYNQRGIKQSLQRTVNFFPSSCALFRIDCLSKDCVDGGFDLTQVITTMIGNRKEAARGKLNCDGNGSPDDHSNIVFEVAIQYS
jgi:hypothetical protein